MPSLCLRDLQPTSRTRRWADPSESVLARLLVLRVAFQIGCACEEGVFEVCDIYYFVLELATKCLKYIVTAPASGLDAEIQKN